MALGRLPHEHPIRGLRAGRSGGVAEAIERVGVGHLLGRDARELSLGERQLVLLAMAVAQAAPMLLLDEPTVHLDLRHQVEVMELLRDLNEREGTTILAVLHDLSLAAHFFPRLVLLDGRRVVADGPPAEVLGPERMRDVFGVDPELVPSRPPSVRLATRSRSPWPGACPGRGSHRQARRAASGWRSLSGSLARGNATRGASAMVVERSGMHRRPVLAAALAGALALVTLNVRRSGADIHSGRLRQRPERRGAQRGGSLDRPPADRDRALRARLRHRVTGHQRPAVHRREGRPDQDPPARRGPCDAVL